MAGDVPDLPWRIVDAAGPSPGIGLIGCGTVSRHHLEAYRAAGYRVVALCDRDEAKARKRARQFFPDAAVHADHGDLLRRADVAVVDIATHTAMRPALVADALLARRHVLSQKPFADDLDTAERLCDLADRQGVLLAVNQNARWAPHNAWLGAAAAAGAFGRIAAMQMSVCWDHNWVAGTPFDRMPFAVLQDFAIHWFDLVRRLMGGRLPQRVSACVTASPGQRAATPLDAQVQMTWDDAQATLAFAGDTRHGRHERQVIVGTEATAIAQGPDHGLLAVEWHDGNGASRPALAGTWFPGGFHGSMAELLRAIAGRRQPAHSARDNLGTLALTWAACASAASGQAVVPGAVRALPTLPGTSIPCMASDVRREA